MQDATADLELLLADRGRLSFDPALGKPTLTLVPGTSYGGRNDPDVYHVDRIIDDAIPNDLPYEAYPFIPPVMFGWSGWTQNKRSEIANKLLHSSVRYDELHHQAGTTRGSNSAWSRSMAWYLVTRIAGNVEIEVRLKDEPEKGFCRILADDLITPETKAMISLRNAYMTNFSVIGTRVLRAHMPMTLPDIGPARNAFAKEAADFIRTSRQWIQKERPFELWAAHSCWLEIFFAFVRSSPEQRAVLFHEFRTVPKFNDMVVSLGDTIISGSFVDASRGQVIRKQYAAEPVVEMIARGFVEVKPEAMTLELTDAGRNLAVTLADLEEHFLYRKFMVLDDYAVDPEDLPAAHEWLLDFFRRMKAIADNNDTATGTEE
jgi:hypothetical protein